MHMKYSAYMANICNLEAIFISGTCVLITWEVVVVVCVYMPPQNEDSVGYSCNVPAIFIH